MDKGWTSSIPEARLFAALPLGFRPPPGLPHPSGQAAFMVGAARAAEPQLAFGDSIEGAVEPPSAQWEIGNIFSKLRVSSGFPLVSPPLRLGDIEDVRVHFLPGENWASDSRAGKPKRKQASNADSAKPGWAYGGIRLKVNDEDQAGNLRFRLLVGSTMQGPFECDFHEQSVQEVTFDFDWRKEIQGSGSLSLRLELL